MYLLVNFLDHYCLPLMKNVPRPLATALAKSLLISLEVTVTSAADARIHTKILGCEISAREQ